MNLKVIIPAHLASLRLKEKILIDIHGLPMIEHVRRRVLLSKEVSEVIVATCDFEIKKIVEGFGGKVVFSLCLETFLSNKCFSTLLEKRRRRF